MTKRTICKWFKWCLNQAHDNIGFHTGGPFEAEFRAYLKRSEKALENLKKDNYDKTR